MNRLERSHLILVREMQRKGTLTAAARSLGLSQSALSHTLRLLEESFGTEIFVREGRGLRRTPAGDHLLALAERLLPQFEHAEQALDQFASGGRGQIRIGMECHPCYRWLLNVVAPYLRAFPDVDVDVKQRFQFGGIGALFSHEIDVLVTPDPLKQKGLSYEPVFDYELRLVVGKNHRLAKNRDIAPADLGSETLITYPVEIQRLDIYSQFLLPAGVVPKAHKTIETTDIMLQMVEGGRGVTALPGWLLREYRGRLAIQSLRLGKRGIKKQIYLGVRASEADRSHIAAFIKLARRARPSGKMSW
jgi:LysR family transcriptional regulator, regulator for metE and metH